MSSDDDCDYMSDAFLGKCLPKDVRPGLTFSHSQQVTHAIQTKKKKLDEVNKQRFRPYRMIEAEHREKGLGEALSKDNKGFTMLQKMGYKPGLGIGKKGAGRVEPVPIQIKSGRGGLGRDAALKQIALDKAAIRNRMAQQRAQWSSTEDYRERVMKKAADRYLKSDLYKSQLACEQLDIEKGFAEPAEVWFWTCKNVPPSLEDDEKKETVLEKEVKEGEEQESNFNSEVEFEPSEQLQMLTMYLRKTHYYCVWCGLNYKDDNDLQGECPGETRDAHD